MNNNRKKGSKKGRESRIEPIVNVNVTNNLEEPLMPGTRKTERQEEIKYQQPLQVGCKHTVRNICQFNYRI